MENGGWKENRWGVSFAGISSCALYNGGESVYNTSTYRREKGGEFACLEAYMEKNVVISIKGMQKYEDADPDIVELVTEGRLMRDGSGYTLSYQESELTGLEGTLTTIQVEQEGEQVTLMRVGEVNAQMVFQEGRRHLSMYNTPYGAMAIGVNTRHLLADLNDQGGDIEIDYAIEIDHAIAGRNIFRIKIKEAEGLGLKQ